MSKAIIGGVAGLVAVLAIGGGVFVATAEDAPANKQNVAASSTPTPKVTPLEEPDPEIVLDGDDWEQTLRDYIRADYNSDPSAESSCADLRSLGTTTPEELADFIVALGPEGTDGLLDPDQEFPEGVSSYDIILVASEEVVSLCNLS